MDAWIPFGLAFLNALIAVIIPLLIIKKSHKEVKTEVKDTLSSFDDSIQGFFTQIQEELKPVLTNNSRVMGIISSKGNEVKQEKSALKALGTDIINDNEALIGMVETVSPLFGQKLRNNPDLIIKLMPRIEAILAKQGGIEKILQGNTQNTQDNSRYWE